MALNQIFAIKQDESWTRVRCTEIINQQWIEGDLLETGETSCRIDTKDLTLIPDYYAYHPVYIQKFQLAGCRNVTLEDFEGKKALPKADMSPQFAV